MKLLVINGPNLNMLGIREPALYGREDYRALVRKIKEQAKISGMKVKIFQSNYEGAIVTKIQKALGKFDGIIINPAALTHTSVAVLDALKAVEIPAVEVHLTDIDSREEFRKKSFVSLYAEKTIKGLGTDGYIEAIKYFASLTANDNTRKR